MPAVQRVLDASGVRIDWDEHLAGLAPLQHGGELLPQAMFDSVRSTRC